MEVAESGRSSELGGTGHHGQQSGRFLLPIVCVLVPGSNTEFENLAAEVAFDLEICHLFMTFVFKVFGHLKKYIFGAVFLAPIAINLF